MNIENIVEAQYVELAGSININHIDLYKDFDFPKLKEIFSTLHTEFTSLFKLMNQKLPSGEDGSYYWANDSRTLIKMIEITDLLQKELANSPYAFKLDDYYQEVISKCNSFLKHSNGSPIPAHMDKIKLYYSLPIFIPHETVTVNNSLLNKSCKLTLIDSGSYAHVYKYEDTFYQKIFALKRAKKDLQPKELERFKREYKEMKKLSSPYILEVYGYNDESNEYVMEYMDFTLDEYIKKNNAGLSFVERKKIGNQILKAFSYLQSKGLLHRDISTKNILLKKYEDTLVVKVSDFGLVKIPDSNLTSEYTELKGCYNDPILALEGFNTYSFPHEIYALTQILYFVITGRTNKDKITNPAIKYFIEQGSNPTISLRFQNIKEISGDFNRITEK